MLDIFKVLESAKAVDANELKDLLEGRRAIQDPVMFNFGHFDDPESGLYDAYLSFDESGWFVEGFEGCSGYGHLWRAKLDISGTPRVESFVKIRENSHGRFLEGFEKHFPNMAFETIEFNIEPKYKNLLSVLFNMEIAEAMLN